MEYYIYLTNDCNLNCSYCSVILQNKNLQIPKTINYPIDKLINFINLIQNEFNEEYADVYFFGGEPTLEILTMYQIICAFNQVKHYKVRFILHTNGLLLNKIPNCVIEKIDVIFLSLNYEKIFDKGQISDYFNQIICSLNALKACKPIPVIGRLTVSQGTSLYTECCLMGTFFDYVYWQLDNQECIQDIVGYKKRYQKDISLLFEYWLSFLKQNAVLRYIPFLGIVRHFLDNIPVPEHFYCGYGYDIVYIQTDGSCYACCDEVESKTHLVGNIYSGIKFEDMTIKGTVCEQCLYLKVCGGRCGRMHKDFDTERIQHFCDMNIFTFDLVKKSLPKIKAAIKINPELLKTINDPLMDLTELIP